MTEDLFGAMDAPEDMTRPLAVRMRPSSVDEVVGQSRVLGQGSPLRRLANPASKGSLTAPSSIILFGPPGVGKTTLAYIVAKQSGRVFEELSAVTSGHTHDFVDGLIVDFDFVFKSTLAFHSPIDERFQVVGFQRFEFDDHGSA